MNKYSIIIQTVVLSFFLINVSNASTDIVGNEFYYHIESLKEANIVDGYSDGTFRPDNFVTRGEIAKFIANAFDLELSSSLNYKFYDVEDNNVFKSYIYALKEHNIVSGYSDSSYKPYNYVTRGETAKMINKAFQYKLIESQNNGGFELNFSDIKLDNIFYQDINTLHSFQIISGYSDGTFKPDNYVTRGQIAKFIDNTRTLYLEKNAQKKCNDLGGVGSYDCFHIDKSQCDTLGGIFNTCGYLNTMTILEDGGSTKTYYPNKTAGFSEGCTTSCKVTINTPQGRCESVNKLFRESKRISTLNKLQLTRTCSNFVPFNGVCSDMSQCVLGCITDLPAGTINATGKCTQILPSGGRTVNTVEQGVVKITSWGGMD